MKKLLYTGAALSVISIFTYFNLTNIANWWVGKKDAQEQAERIKNQGNDTLPYFKNQYIVTMPTDSAGIKALIAKLKGYGLKQYDDCGCSARISLWGPIDPSLEGAIVEIAPDHEEPPPPGSGFTKKLERGIKAPIDSTPQVLPRLQFYNGYSITRNYKLIEPTILSKVVKPLGNYPNRFANFAKDAPKVVVATIDSGVDPTVPGVNSSLYRNTSTSFICRPSAFEGIYGWNALNIPPTQSNAEPIDSDEQCYGFFSVRRGHGTLINGIIAGMGWYPTQVDFTNKVNVNIQLLNVKFINQRKNNGSLFHALCGMNYALEKGAKVLNASWLLPLDVQEYAVRTTFRETMAKLRDSNAILVACAGNNSVKNNPSLKVWPAAFSRDIDFKNNVIAVGGWDQQAAIPSVAEFSNEANFVDVYAPSTNITMVNRIPNVSAWQHLFIFDRPQNGTSFATPFVTRQVAILMGNVTLTPAMIKSQIVGGSAEVLPNIRVNLPSL
jgi:subtilisin family serine protease